jgi:branched-subunit amino acid transport protein
MSAAVAVLLAGAGTYVIRVSAIALLSGAGDVPERVERVLRMIAPAVLSALVVHTWLLADGAVRSPGAWHVAGVAAFAVAIWRKSPTWTLVAGMAVVWIASAV